MKINEILFESQDDELYHPQDTERLYPLGKLSTQKFGSGATSINSSKLPATFGKIEKMGIDIKGKLIADIGGGRFDNAIQWAKERGAELFVYDPVNRTIDHNREVVAKLSGGKADMALCNNVLNVIEEPEIRNSIVRGVHGVLKTGGTAFFLIYEGNRTGVGGATQKNQSYQLNMKTASFLEPVESVFGNAMLKNGMIIATK